MSRKRKELRKGRQSAARAERKQSSPVAVMQRELDKALSSLCAKAQRQDKEKERRLKRKAEKKLIRNEKIVYSAIKRAECKYRVGPIKVQQTKGQQSVVVVASKEELRQLPIPNKVSFKGHTDKGIISFSKAVQVLGLDKALLAEACGALPEDTEDRHFRTWQSWFKKAMPKYQAAIENAIQELEQQLIVQPQPRRTKDMGKLYKSKVCNAMFKSLKRYGSKLSWKPNRLLREMAGAMNMQVTNTGQLAIPLLDKENETEIRRVPLWSMLRKDGAIDGHFAPIGTFSKDTNSDDGLFRKEVAKLAEDGNPLFASGKTLFNGPALASYCFASSTRAADAVRAHASIPSLHVQNALSAKVYCIDYSCEKSRQAAAKAGLIINLERFTLFASSGEVDGAFLAGREVMDALTKNRKYAVQARIIPTFTKEHTDVLKKLDAVWKEFVIQKIAKKVDAIQAINDGNKHVHKMVNRYILEGKLPHGIPTYGKGLLTNLDDTIKDDIILLDVNTLKGRFKDFIKDCIKVNGVFEGEDAMLGLMQDYGTGWLRLSWQALMYMLEKLPEDFPGMYNGISMAGRYGPGPSIKRMVDYVSKALADFESGSTKSLVDLLKQSGNVYQQDDSADSPEDQNSMEHKIFSGLWNHPTMRSEVRKLFRSFLQKNKFCFQTEAMAKLGDFTKQPSIWPLRRYAQDFNANSVCGNLTGSVSIKMHDESIDSYCVVFNDPEFWNAMDNKAYLPASIFRHPCSDVGVFNNCILVNPAHFGLDWLGYGVWFGSDVIKMALVGDTDGDTIGIIPFDLDVEQEDGVFTIQDYTREDYSFMYSVDKSSYTRPETEKVELWLNGVASGLPKAGANPKPFTVGTAEAVSGLSSKLIGNIALLQLFLERFVAHNERDLLVSNNKEDYAFLMDKVIYPFYKIAGAALELSINLQKKDVADIFNALIHKAMKDIVEAVPAYEANTVQGSIIIDTLSAIVGRENVESVLVHGTIKDIPFSDSFAQGLCSLIREYTTILEIKIKDSNGIHDISFSNISKTRMADNEANQDDEFCYGSLDEYGWGIYKVSGFDDSLGRWTNIFNHFARKIKARVDQWTAHQEINKLPWRRTLWNRSVADWEWSNLVERHSFSEEVIDHVAVLYRNKTINSLLGLRKPDLFRTGTRKNAMGVNTFKSLMRSDDTAALWTGYSLVRWICGQMKFFSPEFISTLKQSLDNKVDSFSIAKDMAEFLVPLFKDAITKGKLMSEYEYIANAVNAYSDSKFIDRCANLLGNACATYACLKVDKQTSKFEAWNVLSAKLDEQSVFVPGSDAINLARFMTYAQGWNPTEDQHRDLSRSIKSARSRMLPVSAFFRDRTKSMLTKLPNFIKVGMWSLAYDKNGYRSMLEKAFLPSSIVEDRLKSKSADFYLTIWALDIIRDAGLGKGSAYGIKDGYENNRRSMLVHKDYISKLRDGSIKLKAETTYKKNAIVSHIVGKGQTAVQKDVEREIHTTVLKAENGDTVAIVTEHAAMGRVLLGFDHVKIANVQQATVQNHHLNALTSYVNDGNYTRCLIGSIGFWNDDWQIHRDRFEIEKIMWAKRGDALHCAKQLGFAWEGEALVKSYPDLNCNLEVSFCKEELVCVVSEL